jgi:hypothetical protein
MCLGCVGLYGVRYIGLMFPGWMGCIWMWLDDRCRCDWIYACDWVSVCWVKSLQRNPQPRTYATFYLKHCIYQQELNSITWSKLIFSNNNIKVFSFRKESANPQDSCYLFLITEIQVENILFNHKIFFKIFSNKIFSTYISLIKKWTLSTIYLIISCHVFILSNFSYLWLHRHAPSQNSSPQFGTEQSTFIFEFDFEYCWTLLKFF